jgi:MFS family permease
MMFAIAFTGLYLGPIYVLFTYMTPLFSQKMGMGRDLITLTLVISGLGAVVGNFLGGYMANRLGWSKSARRFGPNRRVYLHRCSHWVIGWVIGYHPLRVQRIGHSRRLRVTCTDQRHPIAPLPTCRTRRLSPPNSLTLLLEHGKRPMNHITRNRAFRRRQTDEECPNGISLTYLSRRQCT